MPKPSKQARNEQPGGPAEDFPRQSTSPRHANASATLATPELSTEDLLKYIGDTVAAEARRSESTMNAAFVKLEVLLNGKIDNVIKRIDGIATTTDSLAARQTEAEARISGLEDEVTPLQNRVAELTKANAQLSEKIMDMESRSRRDNFRLLNLKESAEGSDPIQFFENFIPTILQLPVPTISIDRAHCGLWASSDDNPRPVIIKIHRSRDVALILSAARCLGDLQHDDCSLRIAPDIPQEVRLARRAFNTVCTDLIKRNIRFRMAFPAVLSFDFNGVRKSFKDAKKAEDFLANQKETGDIA